MQGNSRWQFTGAKIAAFWMSAFPSHTRCNHDEFRNNNHKRDQGARAIPAVANAIRSIPILA
jgi:hypothetical protein